MSKYKGFTSVELRRPTRSTFDLSHEKRISSRIGKLTPVLITETMPNDTFYGSTEVLVKLAPLIAPIYHRLNLYVHYFFIPNRLLWSEWEKFITGGRLGEAVTSPPYVPQYLIQDILAKDEDLFAPGSIADYLGIPPIQDADSPNWVGVHVDAMPFLAFYKVWYDYYRDRNYTLDNDDPANDVAYMPVIPGFGSPVIADPILTTKYRCWEHDYFTSAQLTTQRGQEVLMPLEGTGRLMYKVSDDTPATAQKYVAIDALDNGLVTADSANPLVAGEKVYLQLDSSEVSINDLRRANRLQEWLERNQLAGSRYNESIMAHFGRKTSDGRLQRAEYLGGGKAVIQISEVMTTAYSEDSTAAVVPPGTPSGRGSAYADTNRFSYNCEEHGFVIGVLSVLPSSGYMQGLPRMFQNRNTFLEYPWPTFAHLGEQEVYENEIFFSAATAPADRSTQPVFGYQSRYADWKFIQSSSHGDFRSTLDFWHLTRKFVTVPVLGKEFVTYDDENQDRIFNVAGVDTLWMYVYNKLTVKRSLPYFGTPQM